VSEGTVLQALAAAIRGIAVHAADAERPPAAILWPDQARHWPAAVKALRDDMPVMELGTYRQGEGIGPAYWLRCLIDGGLGQSGLSMPVVYLPGYARSDIRAVEDADAELKPLAELQYRGVIFSQKSGRDWTLAAFLSAAPARGGLGIEVAGDEATKSALLRASARLLDETVSRLRGLAPLKARHFDAMMTPDIDRDVLRWLDDPVSFRSGLSDAQWESYRERFAEKFAIGLEAGSIAIAERLGSHDTEAWHGVWRAYADAPERYPTIPQHLRAAKPKTKRASEQAVLWDSRGAWPQDNEEAESELRQKLVDLASVPADNAKAAMVELDLEAAKRRRWVWAELGAAPLAFASEWLAVAAKRTAKQIPPASVQTIVDAYADEGWHADDAVMRALAAVTTKGDVEAVSTAVEAIYRPWLEVAAERMAAAVRNEPASYVPSSISSWPEGTCVLFTDGLRFDVGQRLATVLARGGIDVAVKTHLAALPTITPTAKPSVTPAADTLRPGATFGVRAEGGATDLTAASLRKQIEAQGYQILDGGSVGDSGGRAWGEQGDIDALGHEHQARLPALLDSEVEKLAGRIRELLDAGWAQVVVVTDHGWLYLPRGLPKAELPINATKDGGARKGRAARLAEGADVDVQTVPWHWDPSVRIAIAPGIRSFVGTPVYEHGGISPQECVTPVVIAKGVGDIAPTPIDVAVSWAGLRARIQVRGSRSGWVADIRRDAGDSGTSIAGGSRPLDQDGKVALPIEDDDLIGHEATAVVLDETGLLMAQRVVMVGGEE
jgi:hypothetical protein